ncbi:hypothetical protein VP01_1133g4 [Puccinia sorghi]|uniref:Histidine kinase domain-containing protein n=1 Tax=Puccinia sorghi TaxID=27349 RepID=A0A0L6VSB8_9BASI|nr:hypothetical protein VP01_1133g4 [Puccinia sorghi]
MAFPTKAEHRTPGRSASSSPPSEQHHRLSLKNESISPSFKHPIPFKHFPTLHQLDLSNHRHNHQTHSHHSSPLDSSINSITRSLDSDSAHSSSYPPVTDSSPQSPFHSPILQKSLQSSSSSLSHDALSATPDATPLAHQNPPSHHQSFFPPSKELSTPPPPSHQAPPTSNKKAPQEVTVSPPHSITRGTSQRVYPIKSLVKVKNSSTPASPSSSPSQLPISNSNRISARNKSASEDNKQASSPTSSPQLPFPPSPHSSYTHPHHQRSRSIGSNSSGFSSSTRSRRTDCLPSIAERSSSNGSEQRQTPSLDPEHQQYNGKMGVGRPRRSSSTRFSLSNNQLAGAVAPMQINGRHIPPSDSAKHRQATASMLINLSGLHDFDPSAIADFTSNRLTSTRSHDSLIPSGTGLLTHKPFSDVVNHLHSPDNTTIPPITHSLSDSCDVLPHKRPSTPISSSQGHISHASSNKPSASNLNGLKSPEAYSYTTPTRSFSHTQRGPPTIEKPVSVAGKSHAAASVAEMTSISDSSQYNSPPTDPDAYITTRFEYQQNDEDLLILTGRKGEFTTCEDEPIRIPGAVQGFGVLIAVLVHGESRTITKSAERYDPHDPANGILPPKNSSPGGSEEEREEIININRLEVVQVSENSRHILGLSPKLLLNLYSFTEVLTQDQSQLLCDNLEVCLDGSSTSTAGPHTFRMAGRGGIGTGTDGPFSHTEWSCWCAAHRPDPVSRPRLVIIEFELENDEINPPSTVAFEPVDEDDRGGIAGKPYEPTEQDLLESTTSINKPLRALARLRRKGKDFSGDSIEVLSILNIPSQARDLYKINKVRMLYDRDQPTARLMCKSQEELGKPLNMTHCHLRAMSPIHIKYLANMGVSRKLINTTSTSKNPSGYIVAKAEDLLWLFDAQSGVLSIGEEAKILGTVTNSQEILAILEYLRVTAFEPAQSKEIHWAGNPHHKIQQDENNPSILEPRKSFKIWSETVKERSKAWTDEQLETGSVLSLVYGKFIDVWRQKEAAVHNNQLQAILLSNASHEVRTPLHQILSTLELALDGQLDEDTRENLSKSYSASRALVHVINDLLDLTKAEQGGVLFSRDPFNLPATLEDAVSIHQREAERKGLAFEMVEDPRGAPAILQGDRARLRQVVSNLVGNAVKHTTKGLIHVQWGIDHQDTPEVAQEQGMLSEDVCRISVAVTDTGKGIPEAQLENIFRAFEQVGSGESQDDHMCESIGLGLAVVGRVVHNMGGQLRVDSTVDQGSKFTITLPFVIAKNNNPRGSTARNSDDSSNLRSSGPQFARAKSNGKLSSSRGSHGSNQGSIGSSCHNSSEARYSPRLTSPSQNRFHRPRKSISLESTQGPKGSGSSHSLGSSMGGQNERRRINSASNQRLFNRGLNIPDHRADTVRNSAQKASSLPQTMTPATDGLGKSKHSPPKGDVSHKDMINPEAVQQPSQRASESTPKPPRQSNNSSKKIERPSISALKEPTELSLPTPNPSSPKRFEETHKNPLSPNSVEHISDYQKPNRNPTPVKKPMKVMVVEDDPIN